MGQTIATGIYDVYSQFYDHFERLFKNRLKQAIGSVPFRHGDRVLDIGVGTGLSLDCYPRCVHVTGVDISKGMLAQAERKLCEGRVRKDCPPEATVLLQGDALDLPFADRSFDVVTLSHVVSTVPDPTRCLQEAIRVARDGATLVIVNHFRSTWPLLGWIERVIDPLCRKLGWRSDLSLESLLASVGAEQNSDPHSTGGVFRIVYLRKHREGVRVIALPELLPQDNALPGVVAQTA